MTQKNHTEDKISSSRTASATFRRVSSLHFLTGLAAVATPPSTWLVFLPPPGLGFNEVLDCYALCTSSARRFATCSFSVTYQRCMYCSAASSTCLNHLPGFFAVSVQCSRSVGKLNNHGSCSTQPIQSCSCPPEKAFPPSTSPNITRFGSLSLAIRATNLTKSILRFRTVVSTFSQQVLASESA